MIKISVIITFYNNSRYIENCLKNIKLIKDDKIEIIVIDDGSKESEFKIIENEILSLKNPKVRLVRNDNNMGAGYTKNKAVNLAKGEYVIFLDCDDYVDSCYYSKILNVILETGSDIVCTDIVTVINGVVYNESLIDSSIIREKAKLIYKNVYEISCRKLLGNKFSTSACNKAIKKELLVKYPFNENKCDDLTAIIPAICEVGKIVYVKGIKYYYCQTSNSITRQKSGKSKIQNLLDSIDSLFKTYDILKNENVIESSIEVYYANNVVPFIYFSILNNDFISCIKSLKYLLTKINLENYADYLIIKNPYLYRLLYLDYYSICLLEKLKKQKFPILVFNLFVGRVKYKLKYIFRRV